jgi:hypothetical protein
MGSLVIILAVVAVLVLVTGGTAMARSRRRLREYDDGELDESGDG